jgi:hypothetical protein
MHALLMQLFNFFGKLYILVLYRQRIWPIPNTKNSMQAMHKETIHRDRGYDFFFAKRWKLDRDFY